MSRARRGSVERRTVERTSQRSVDANERDKAKKSRRARKEAGGQGNVEEERNRAVDRAREKELP